MKNNVIIYIKIKSAQTERIVEQSQLFPLVQFFLHSHLYYQKSFAWNSHFRVLLLSINFEDSLWQRTASQKRPYPPLFLMNGIPLGQIGSVLEIILVISNLFISSFDILFQSSDFFSKNNQIFQFIVLALVISFEERNTFVKMRISFL